MREEYYDRCITIYAELDPLADGGRDPVPGDAHVGAHVHPRHLPQLEDGAGDLLRCNTIIIMLHITITVTGDQDQPIF